MRVHGMVLRVLVRDLGSLDWRHSAARDVAIIFGVRLFQ
jgi:hypothetical protein